MNTKIYHSLYALFVAGALLASGCSNDEDTYDFYAAHPDAVRFHITAGDAPQTRVNTEGDGTTFDVKDQIAISADGGASYSNYVQSSGDDWQPAEGQRYLRWKEEELSFQAYYPVTEGTDYTKFTVPKDQKDQTNLRNADYMTAEAADQPSANPVALTFKHRLAKVTVSITMSEELTGKTINAMIFYTKGRTLKNGSITDGDSHEAYYPHPVGNSYMAILPPQSGDNSAVFIELRLDNGSLYSLTGIPALEPGKAYTLALQVGHEGIKQISPITVADWTTQPLTGGTAIFDPTIWDGTYPTSEEEAKEWMGEPTSAPGATPATYTISTAKQLAGMAYYYRGDMIEKATFELAADIDLAEHPWIPLGRFENKNTTRSFKGTFNGHGHTIKGMNVTGNYNCGGFMAICAGTVKNLIVEGKVNSSFSNAIINVECGGIAGEVSFAYTGTADIIACGFRGTIAGSTTSGQNVFAGGIAGYNEAGNITGCISWATSVTATGGSNNNRVGGIVGFFDKYTSSQITTQPTAKGNRWYYNGTGSEGVQELSGGTESGVTLTTADNASFANSSEIDDTALNTINSYLTGNDYIWQKAADGNLKLVKNQQP